MRALGIDPYRPSVVFVGRITRQKGLPYFLRAAEQLPPDVQVVLCAGAPDTPAILAEVTGLVERAAHQALGRRVDRADAAARRAGRGPVARHGLRVPVDLRAAGHRQPRGDGRRPAGRRHGHRRHPRGRRRRRHRAGSCRSTRCRTARARRSTPTGSWATSPRRSTTPSRSRTRARVGARGPAARRGPLLVGRDRRRARSTSTGRRRPERRRVTTTAWGRSRRRDRAPRHPVDVAQGGCERWSACHRFTAPPSSRVASATIARSRAALASTRARRPSRWSGIRQRGSDAVAQRGDARPRRGCHRATSSRTSASVTVIRP